MIGRTQRNRNVNRRPDPLSLPPPIWDPTLFGQPCVWLSPEVLAAAASIGDPLTLWPQPAGYAEPGFTISAGGGGGIAQAFNKQIVAGLHPAAYLTATITEPTQYTVAVAFHRGNMFWSCGDAAFAFRCEASGSGIMHTRYDDTDTDHSLTLASTIAFPTVVVCSSGTNPDAPDFLTLAAAGTPGEVMTAVPGITPKVSDGIFSLQPSQLYELVIWPFQLNANERSRALALLANRWLP